MRGLAVADREAETQRAVHPSAVEALMRLGYDSEQGQIIARHIAGTASLEQAPAIDHAALRARGFDTAALENLEAYLPQARHLRHAFTPWVLGVEFCLKKLKIPAAKIEDMRFNLLAHLGFSEAEIAAANGWCYGHDRIEGAEGLHPQHAGVFATTAALPLEAQIRMSAAVQGFVSGETGLTLNLPVGLPAERIEKLMLDAWRRGVKSAVMIFDEALNADARKTAPHASQSALRRKTTRKHAASSFMQAKPPALPKRISRSAATPKHGGMPRGGKDKSRNLSKSH